MKVAVIGGGAAGLTAAITAAEAGHTVTVLERQGRVGRKLMATGNGRCNLSNLNWGPENYHGQDPAFALPALAAFPSAAALDFFRSLGLLTVAEPSGRVYPRSDQAGSVVDVLRLAAAARGAELRTGAEVLSLCRAGDGFALALAGETVTADRVIVCCGGLAGEKLGGTKSGYALLSSLGHRRTPLHPALVQLRTDPTYVRALKGVRAEARVVLEEAGAVIAQSAGEVQFTDYGVSGPAVFEVSRAASTAAGEVTARLDLLPGLPRGELEGLLARRVEDLPGLPLENLLTGMLHNRLGQTVLRYAGCGLSGTVNGLTGTDLGRIAAAVKDFTLPVTGTLGFDAAQVTAGGMDTAEFDPNTLRSRLVPGLYAAGEVLDVDGDCGGYNLQWAWASGRLAGRLR